MFEIGNFSLLALSWQHYAFSIPLALLSVFLMLVILVQRGRGGGLTGALGGMGGQSAFGTKAGDLFTRVTIAVAAIWILLSMLTLKVLNNPTAAVAAPPPAAVETEKSKSETGKSKADGKLAPDSKTTSPAIDSKVPAAPGPTTSEPAPSTSPSTPPTNPDAAPPATAPPPDDAKDANP